MDGYELAKALESVCYWMPTAQDVETLDNFGCDLREAQSAAAGFTLSCGTYECTIHHLNL